MSSPRKRTHTHRDMSWLVYLNGVQVPAVSVSTRTAPNMISTAEIRMPPSKYLQGLGRGDRVRSTVFYLDQFAYDEPRWCLLFDGEITGQSKRRTETGKQIAFSAVDFMAILNAFYPYLVQSVNDIVQSTTNVSQAQVSTATTPFPTTTVLLNDVKRPYDILRNLIDLLRGEGATKDNSSVIATEFFEPWQQRVKLLRRILPSQEINILRDEYVFPIIRAVQSESVLDAVQQLGDRVGTSGSYGKLVRVLYQHMYYALTSVLAPPAMSASPISTEIYGPPPANSSGTNSEYYHLGQFLCHSRVHFGIPPKCNVLWPSMITDMNYREDYASQPTRTYLGNFHLFNTIDKDRSGSMQQIVDKALTVGYPIEAQYQLDRRLKSDKQSSNINNYLVYPEEFFKGPVYNNQQTPTWYLMLKDADRGTDSKSALKLYAAIEHFKARHAKRSGNVTCVFDPYIVPGLPLAILDAPGEDAEHYTAEIVELQHELGQNIAQTTLSYTHAQPIDEMYELLYEQLLEHTATYSDTRSAPINPIEALRKRFQTYDGAAEYYRRLFYHDREEIDPVFKFDKVFLVKRAEGQPEPPYYAYAPDKINVLPDEDTGEVPLYIYSRAYDEQVTSFDAAMRWVSRPVCTLEQYIDYHGEAGAREQPQGDRGRTYYVRILNINNGPGEEPGHLEDGGRCGSVGVDTKRNWTSRLLRFRRQVREMEHRQ